MLSALQAQQRALLDALFAAREADARIAIGGMVEPTPLAARGLQAYRSNGHALAERALAGAYPAVAALLGERNFAPLAHELWLADPPARGDLAEWGEGLAALIEQLPELARAEPYLADVARTEWALHRSATCADGALDAASFEWLATRDPRSLALVLAPGTCCVASRFPVATIVQAHRGEASFDTAGERLRAQVAETALVWRCGLAPRVRIAQPGEPEFIAALQEGRSLADSLQAAPLLDFTAWLAPAVQDQLLLGARLQRTDHEGTP